MKTVAQVLAADYGLNPDTADRVAHVYAAQNGFPTDPHARAKCIIDDMTRHRVTPSKNIERDLEKARAKESHEVFDAVGVFVATMFGDSEALVLSKEAERLIVKVREGAATREDQERLSEEMNAVNQRATKLFYAFMKRMSPNVTMMAVSDMVAAFCMLHEDPPHVFKAFRQTMESRFDHFQSELGHRRQKTTS